MTQPLNRLLGGAARLGNAATNALEVARFGSLQTGEQPSPFDVVGRTPVYRLRHYFPLDGGRGRPPMLLVPPLMLSAEVYDVSPTTSGVAALHEAKVDPWVVDFGAPEKEEGGLKRTLADHVLAVSDAIDRVRRATGMDPHLAGYSQGGMFCYQVTAYRRGKGIASLVTWGSPVDTHLLTPAGLPVGELADFAAALADAVLSRTSVPPALSKRAFQLLDPLKTLQQRASFIGQLHNRDALLEREGSRRFLEVDGWVAWPGPAVAEFANQFLAHNRMLQGGFVIDDRVVTVADIDIPTLAAVGTLDEIASAPAVRAIRRAAPLAEIFELTLESGHMGLVVGHGAREHSWPVVAGWVHFQEGTGPLPPQISPLTEDHDEGGPSVSAVPGVVVDVAIGAAHVISETAQQASRAIAGVLGEAAGTLPRISRLQRVDPNTRVSLGLLLQEKVDEHPDDTFFVFEDRAYSYAEGMYRIDAVTRGLIEVGVRQGEHVGVLMKTRPTALALVAALSRLGATAVMLRPDGDLDAELRLAQVSRVIADPEHADLACSTVETQVLVLGAGETGRAVPEGAVDMEQIDHTAVAMPGWFTPNPGRARDLAAIAFTGRGRHLRASRISNRRWALSALGTASAAGLKRKDTIYAVTPLHHPSTLLTAIGGAVVAGARLAVAHSFDPTTFWDEVRRYGVTVVSYTWAMVGELLDAPVNPSERHHPIRLFMGSGMPVGMWHQVHDRFRPARVLEFFAHTEGNVVLANVDDRKVGSMGRPLPGSARIALAAYDAQTGRLQTDGQGFVTTAAVDEVGMLLARVDGERSAIRGRLLRGVFRKGDAWLSTGDLFTRDGDGDHWYLGRESGLVSTSEGRRSPRPAEVALETCDQVNLAITYGLPTTQAPTEVLAAAIVPIADAVLDAEVLSRAFAGLDDASWPSVIRVMDTLPMSLRYRLSAAELVAQSLPDDATGWWWDDAAGTYVPLAPGASAALSLAGPGVALDAEQD